MAWLLLSLAGILEVVWAWALKESHGFSRPWPSLVAIVGIVASLGLLALAMRSLPLGTAYMIWTGIGAVGTFVVGVTVLGEELSLMRACAAVLIVAGLIAMKISSAH
jgi:quaternary ammonium compound-resistance protein SugE